MSLLAGCYEHEKNENFLQYLLALGAPEEKAKAADKLSSKLQVVVDDNRITLNSNLTGTCAITLVVGEEVDEIIPSKSIVVKSFASLDGNTLTVDSKSSSGKTGRRIYRFSDDKLVVTLVDDKTGLSSRRIYKRIS